MTNTQAIAQLHKQNVAIVATLRQYRQAWDNVQHMNGYRGSDGHLWAGPELSRADIAAQVALASAESKA